MLFSNLVVRASAVVLLCVLTTAESIAEINGNKFLSSFDGKSVSNVEGVVTAKGPKGFWIRSAQPDNDPKTSESVYVYGNVTAVATGDLVSLDGKVSEYRTSSYLSLTEITKLTNFEIVSKGHKVDPIVLGKNLTNPPTEQYTSLDKGDVFGIPNNATQISVENPELQPFKYGLDFWESLSGELVALTKPVAVAKPNKYGDTFVVGDWKVTGRNKRGGLTLTPGDGNPEAIVIGEPLDGTKNPSDTKLGDSLNDITGVVYQAFGYYSILPTTKISVIGSKEPALPDPATFQSSNGSCHSITVGDYNIENFAPNSTNLVARAEHIAKYLNSPDIVFLQEIQDDTGPIDDGTVESNKTLNILVDAIENLTTIKYDYVYIDPENDKDGGQPGGNIRVAYLFNPAVLRLHNPRPGSSRDAIQVLPGPALNFNPGRIEPSSSAWQDSRKPLVAQWDTVNGNSTFFTINVHFTSKGGSSSIEGDARPPVNGGIDERIEQANLTGSFVAQILAEDPNAGIIAAGDFNEFTFVAPIQTFLATSGMVDLDEAAGIDHVERYTYIYDMNCQEIDHVFVSPKIAGRKPEFEHVHVNSWVSYEDQVSDHDPSVAKLDTC